MECALLGLRAPRSDLLEDRLEKGLQLGLLPPGVAQRTRLLARMLGSAPSSGEELGRAIGISRAAVHKHVSALRSAGFVIASQRGLGHSLVEAPESPVPELVMLLLLGDPRMPAPGEAGFMGLPYHHYAEVGSTNDVCRGLAEAGSPAGTVVVAEAQSAGRGRLGRVWRSRAGQDLTFSLVLRPDLAPVELGLLVLAVASAVARCLAEDVGLGGAVGLKWPNDVLVSGGKACGILMEASIDMDRVRWVVVGMGVNANSRCSDLIGVGGTPPGKEQPASIGDAVGGRVSRPALLVSLLARISASLHQLDVEPGAVVRQYEAFDALLGRTIRLTSGYGGRELARGVADGVERDGSLRVREAGGGVGFHGAGEVTVECVAGNEEAGKAQPGCQPTSLSS